MNYKTSVASDFNDNKKKWNFVGKACITVCSPWAFYSISALGKVLCETFLRHFSVYISN